MRAGADIGGAEDRDARDWGVSLAVVLAIHAAPLAALGLWLKPHAAPKAAPPAVMVDMAPLPAPKPPEPTPTPAAQPVRPAPPQRVQPAALPKLPALPSPAATLPSPARPAEHPAAAVLAPPPPPARPSAPAPAAAPSPPSNALPTWQGQVLGRLERFKRFPDDARFHHQEGVVWIRFSMNRQGKVLSVSIDRGSGVPSLDAEALALVARAQPLPRPPPEVPGERLELTTPVEFHITPRR